MKRSVAIILMLALCVGGFFALPALKQEPPMPDAAMDVLGVPGDTTIATVNGTPISVREYGFWIAYTADTLSYYSGGQALDWEMEEDGFTLRDAIESEAKMGAKLYALVESKVKELGLTLSSEGQMELDALVEQTEQQLGGEEGLMDWLAYNGLSYDEFIRQSAAPFYYDLLSAELADHSPATTAEVEQYISDNDLLRAKHILFMTVDDTNGQPLEEAVIAEKKAKTEETLAALQASTNLEADFDKLMHELSEDAGLQTNPDGYVFTANDMVPEFEKATRELEYGAMSGIVETTYGYHIVLRLDPASEELADAVVNQRVVEETNQMVSDWMDEYEFETTELFENFDSKAYYDALAAIRAQQQTVAP